MAVMTAKRQSRQVLLRQAVYAASVVVAAIPYVAGAQTPQSSGGAGTSAPTIACVDSSASGKIGTTPCTIFARRAVPGFPNGAVTWTLETFPTRAAAEHAMTPTSAVAEVDQKYWLMTVGGRPTASPGATHAAEIGPLPLPPAKSYEMILAYVAVPPGSRSAIHVQSGPEAWYVLSGSQCVETPSTVLHIDQGHGGVVPADTPLYLIATGTGIRRAFFVIVHDAARPFYTEINTWKPKGLCPG
jgi:quercetin dioxygenase-like cupin family protein